MADLSTAVAASAGMTIFGVATGLDPALLIAGFAGGLWAQGYAPPAHWAQRLASTLLAAVLAGYLAPAAAVLLSTTAEVKGALQLPTAVLVGLLAQQVLGPAIMRLVRRKLKP